MGNGNLILSRRIGETVIITDPNSGTSINVMLIDIKGNQAKISFKAPREVKVFRSELIKES